MDADRALGEALVGLVEGGEALEWHREAHLKHTTLAQIVQAVIDCQVTGGAPPAVQALRGARRGRTSLRRRLRMLDGYREAAPDLHRQLTTQLAGAGVEVLSGSQGASDRASGAASSRASDAGSCGVDSQQNGSSQQNGGDAAQKEAGSESRESSAGESSVPLVVLLCPELFASPTLCDQLAELLRASPERLATAVRLCSTAVPFDYYLAHSPEELTSLGLLRAMYAKWPESAALQAAAAHEVSEQLAKATAEAEGGSGRLGSVGRLGLLSPRQFYAYLPRGLPNWTQRNSPRLLQSRVEVESAKAHTAPASFKA